jgi:hypothetical protein
MVQSVFLVILAVATATFGTVTAIQCLDNTGGARPASVNCEPQYSQCISFSAPCVIRDVQCSPQEIAVGGQKQRWGCSNETICNAVKSNVNATQILCCSSNNCNTAASLVISRPLNLVTICGLLLSTLILFS